MPEKKILLVTRPIAPPWDEASKNFAFYLAKNISEFSLSLLTNGIINDLPSSVHQKAIYTSNDFSYFQKLRLIRNLRKIKNEFDILHYIFTPTKQNTFLLKHFVGYKKNNSTRVIQTIATLREDLYTEKDIRNLMFGDLIITYSDYAKNKLNSLGFNNVKRVYPGIDLEYYFPKTKNSEAMKQLGISEQDFVVTYPGEYVRLGATDDIVNMVIQNAETLREKNIKILFACRLKNDPKAIQKKNEVVKKLKDHDVLGLTIFVDIFPDMAAVYNLSDVIIFPAQNMKGKFDVPLVVVEAMACEKPVIVSNLPVLKEFARENNSVTIQKGNIAELKNAILDLCQNPEKRKIIGKSARKFCEENFDIKKIADIYAQIYAKL